MNETRRYFQQSEFCMGEFPGKSCEIYCEDEGGSDVGEGGTYTWENNHRGKMRGEGICTKKLGGIVGMEGIAYLVEIDADSIDLVD